MAFTPKTWRDYDPDTGIGDPSTPLTATSVGDLEQRVAQGFADAVVDGDATHAPVSLTGTYAARPLANSVKSGALYYPTDVPEQYRSDGAAWAVVGAGGNEIGYAEIVTNFTTASTTLVDVTGMTATFKVGERPIVLRFDGVLGDSAAATAAFAAILLDGVQVASCGGPEVAAGGFRAASRCVRVSGLTPGSTHTAKIQLRTATAGTATVYGGATNVAALTIETA